MRGFTHRLVWMAVLAIHAVGASAQIQYTDFGPATLNTGNSMVTLTGLNQTLAFFWSQPTPLRRGEIFFGGSGVSVLSSGGSLVVLGENDTIDANSGNWTTAAASSILWEYNSLLSVFNSSYLLPNSVGIIPLRFEEDSAFYYGWVEVTNIANDGSSYEISAFAYNAQPNAPIQAGQSEDPPPGGGGNGGGNGGGVGGVVPEPSTAALVALGFLMWMLSGSRSVAFARSGGCR